MTNGKGVDDLINTLIKKSLKKGLLNYGQDIVMVFLPPVVGCLVKKGGGSRAPQDAGYAYGNFGDQKGTAVFPCASCIICRSAELHVSATQRFATEV